MNHYNRVVNVYLKNLICCFKNFELVNRYKLVFSGGKVIYEEVDILDYLLPAGGFPLRWPSSEGRRKTKEGRV